MSFISQSQKNQLHSVIDQIHDTFKLPIVAYQEGEKTILQPDSNYSHLYGATNAQTEYSENSKIIEARIHYPTTELKLSAGEEMKIMVSSGTVRLKVKKEDFDFISEAKKIEIDGKLFNIDSSERPHGLFNTQYYTIFFKRVD